MSLSEKILLTLSRKPNSRDHSGGTLEWTDETSLSLLAKVYPNFLELIPNKEILDFGCGDGHQSVSLAQAGAKRVVGVDTNRAILERAKALLATPALREKVQFVETLSSDAPGRFDMVISQDSMEHFSDPEAILQQMSAALKPDGKLLITFGPPWYAPYGSHMKFFTSVPWVNILFSEKTVMAVRGRFSRDGAIRYEEVESGLNKMSVGRFERIIHDSALQIGYRRYDCVKGLNFLAKLPFVRELFINHVSVILTRRSG